MTSKSILVIGDLHAPYMHKDAVRFLSALKAKYRPDTVVFMGDEVDSHAMSFYKSNPDLDSAGPELEKAIKTLQPLYKMFPNATVIESNHGSMLYRRGLDAGIPSAMLKGYREVLKAPMGWVWKYDLTLETPLGPVYFHHGKSSSIENLSKNMAMSAVQGHYHSKFYISYWSSPKGLYFDSNAGCLIDKGSMAFAYDRVNLPRPILGAMVIINGVPSLIPMVYGRDHKWVGKL